MGLGKTSGWAVFYGGMSGNSQGTVHTVRGRYAMSCDFSCALACEA